MALEDVTSHCSFLVRRLTGERSHEACGKFCYVISLRGNLESLWLGHMDVDRTRSLVDFYFWISLVVLVAFQLIL